MVAVFFAAGHRSEGIQRALGGLDVVASVDRAEFRKALATASCAVVVFPTIPIPSELRWLREIVQRHSTRGWILVTEFSPQNAQRILELGISLEVVWLFEIGEKLNRLVNKLVSSDPLFRLATRLEEARVLDFELRQTLATVCRMARPPRTIGGVASLAGMTRDKMRYRWRMGFGRNMTLRQFLDRVFMMRIVQTRVSLGSWEATAKELKVDRRTVRRLKKRVVEGIEITWGDPAYERMVRVLATDLEGLLAS